MTSESAQDIQDNNIVLFYEFTGEGRINFNLIKGTFELYKNKKVYLIIDDTYEGLLTQTIVNEINSVKGFAEILICSSNEKIIGENVIPLSYHLYNRKFDNIFPNDHKSHTNIQMRDKKFICINRQERLHRLQTIDFLLEQNLIQHTFASCALNEFKIPLLNNDSITKLSEKGTIEKIDDYYEKRLYGSVDEVKKFNPSEEQKDRLLKNLPLVLDAPYENLNPFELPGLESYFNNAYWAIITERDFYKSDVYQGWTEKILKCFIYKNPFIVIGLPNTIKSLQDYGFLTFGKYIDESYDSIEDNDKRLTAAFEQIKLLGQKNYAEHELIRRDMQNILDYNYEHYKKLHNGVPSNLLNRMLKWFHGSSL